MPLLPVPVGGRSTPGWAFFLPAYLSPLPTPSPHPPAPPLVTCPATPPSTIRPFGAPHRCRGTLLCLRTYLPHYIILRSLLVTFVAGPFVDLAYNGAAAPVLLFLLHDVTPGRTAWILLFTVAPASSSSVVPLLRAVLHCIAAPFTFGGLYFSSLYSGPCRLGFFTVRFAGCAAAPTHTFPSWWLPPHTLLPLILGTTFHLGPHLRAAREVAQLPKNCLPDTKPTRALALPYNTTTARTTAQHATYYPHTLRYPHGKIQLRWLFKLVGVSSVRTCHPERYLPRFRFWTFLGLNHERPTSVVWWDQTFLPFVRFKHF